MAVIKMDGYGHGAVQIAKLLEPMDYIWGYAVATLDEAILIKDACLKKPVLVLGCIFPDQWDVMIRNEVRMTVYSYEMAKEVSELAEAMGCNVYVHIKLDTGMAGVTADEISKRYIAECKKDMDGMNIKPATKNPLATEEICGMVDMIQTLIDKGFAYEKNGTVYYSTRKFKDYGKLSHKNLDDLRSGERSLLVSGEDEKEDPLDFVLWKPKKEGEPAWESPWSEGRPGWHIECSEMSKKYLGEQIDIHAGGEDLVFPHHENEIAQSEAANGKEFAKYWMHNAFLNIDNRKMSKSLGNFRTVREISEQYDLQVLRFFMLSAHYRSPLNFSADLMEASKNGLERIVNAADNLKFLMENAKTEAITDAEAENFAKTEEFVAGFEKAMDDDFNTADAVAAIFDLVKYINTTTDAESSKEYLQKLFDLLVKLTGVLGLIVDKKEEILDEDIEKLIEERQAARKAKDFARADAIRDELLEKGIILKDTREGVQWKRA